MDRAPIKFRRSTNPASAVGRPWIVGFHDGSLSAYAAMVYMVWTVETRKGKDDTDVELSRVVTLLMSKSRVSPIHGTTIPRAELQSLTVVARALPDRPERAIRIGDNE